MNELEKLIEAKIMLSDLVEVKNNLHTLNEVCDNFKQIFDNINKLHEIASTKTQRKDNPSLLGMMNIINMNFTMSEIIFLKHGITTVSNVFDFEKTVKSLYKKHPELNEIYKKEQKHFELAKYIRNKFTSHIENGAISQAINWNPVLKFQIENYNTMQSSYNIWILEGLLNTYIDTNGDNKYWGKELNLIYLSDQINFMIMLFDIFRVATSFLQATIKILEQYIPDECMISPIISPEEEKELKTYRSNIANLFGVPEEHEIIEQMMIKVRFSSEERKAYENAGNMVFKPLPTKGR